MKCLILLSCLVVAHVSGGPVASHCHGPVINGVHYIDQVLKSDLTKPLYPAFDGNTNTLYFTEIYSGKRRLAKINIKTKEFEKLDADNSVLGIDAVFADPKTYDIYYGSEGGIFKYDKNAKSSSKFGAEEYKVTDIFYKNGVAYFANDKYEVYKYANGQVSKLEELKDTTATTFVVDDESYIYAPKDNSGVYRKEFGSDKAVLYPFVGTQESYKEPIHQLALDRNSDPYFTGKGGIYFVNVHDHALHKIFEATEVYGVAFDNWNNIIYFTDTSIHYLIPSEDQSCV